MECAIGAEHRQRPSHLSSKWNVTERRVDVLHGLDNPILAVPCALYSSKSLGVSAGCLCLACPTPLASTGLPSPTSPGLFQIIFLCFLGINLPHNLASQPSVPLQLLSCLSRGTLSCHFDFISAVEATLLPCP